MPKPPNIIPPRKLTTNIPEDVFARLTLYLYSELEGRVPLGAYSRFIVARTLEYLDGERLDIAPWAGSDPDAFIVAGSPQAVAALRATLTGKVPV